MLNSVASQKLSLKLLRFRNKEKLKGKRGCSRGIRSSSRLEKSKTKEGPFHENSLLDRSESTMEVANITTRRMMTRTMMEAADTTPPAQMILMRISKKMR